MTLVNCYCTIEQARVAIGIAPTDVSKDDELELLTNATCRLIDDHTGRPHGFWQDPAVTVRVYDCDDQYLLDVEDISTTTGLIVKTDSGAGTYPTTLTLGTDFVVLPRNAEKRYPVRPFDQLQAINGAYFPVSNNGQAGVQVTAKHGWPAVPSNATLATTIQLTRLFKSQPFGVVEMGESGTAWRLSARLHPDAMLCLEGLQKVYA